MDLKKYKFDIEVILDKLKELENGNFCENKCTSNNAEASAKTIAKNIKDTFSRLITQIEKDS